ncbi:MAG: hypothetical protein LBP80_04820, partial [Treponema sp.]|nr:hypothetical protein [Treponema sp.]
VTVHFPRHQSVEAVAVKINLAVIFTAESLTIVKRRDGLCRPPFGKPLCGLNCMPGIKAFRFIELEKLRRKDSYHAANDGSCDYLAAAEKILNRLLWA